MAKPQRSRMRRLGAAMVLAPATAVVLACQPVLTRSAAESLHASSRQPSPAARTPHSPDAGLPPTPATVRLPCPLEAGWQTLVTQRLPRFAGLRPSGGFSALIYDPSTDLLELLSDAPWGFVERWTGLRALVAAAASKPGTQGWPALRPLAMLPLRGGATPRADVLDGEGVVRLGADLWVASEGRRTSTQPAQLLHFDATSGALRQAHDLPEAWRPAPGRGLGSNQGPESLALWREAGRQDRLLMASESALLQDPPGQVRLLEWVLTGSGAIARPLRALALPGAGIWGLTDLLVVPHASGATGLLALLRRFEEPDRWGARLVLYPRPTAVVAEAPRQSASAATGRLVTAAPAMPTPVKPTPAAAPLAPAPLAPAVPPLHGWDLLASGPGKPGLPRDNWEGLTWGPPLADGRATLVLVTDDNFNPLQASWLAVMAPRRLAGCGRPRAGTSPPPLRPGAGREAP